jgi:hypothetical protein
MKFQREYMYCFVGLVIIFVFFVLSSLLNNAFLRFFISIFTIILGSVMIVLGFWGSDFAFAVACGQLHQEKVKGKFKGQRNKVYVPFMKNYTPLEWWNLNWFITLIGAIILALGMLNLGILICLYTFF